MEVIFILYKPAVPANVGAAARAIKTMGFSALRLIDPCDYLSDQALMLAHGSHDILENAVCTKDFNEAVKDIDFLVATTAKKRSAKAEFYSLPDLKRILLKKQTSISKIGVLFGTEESGLPNELIQKADVASSIPLKQLYPSLNLAQAVMLYAYELSDCIPEYPALEEISSTSYAELKRRTELLLPKIGIHYKMPVYKRIMDRVALLGSTDIDLLHSITSRMEEKLI